MTDVSTMSDRELDRSIAEAMGLHHDVVRAHGRALENGWDFPNWHADLNSLRDGPERVLREAGWQSFHSQVDGIYHWGWRKGPEVVAARARH